MSKKITCNEWNDWIDGLRDQVTKITDTFENITISLDGYTIKFNKNKGWDLSYGTNRLPFYELDSAILAILNEEKNVNKCNQCKKEAAWKIYNYPGPPIYSCSSHLVEVLSAMSGSKYTLEKLEK